MLNSSKLIKLTHLHKLANQLMLHDVKTSKSFVV